MFEKLESVHGGKRDSYQDIEDPNQTMTQLSINSGTLYEDMGDLRHNLCDSATEGCRNKRRHDEEDGAKLLFMLLIAFQVLLSTIKLHMSAFLGHLQIITTFAPLVLLISLFFSHMSITNLSLGQGFVVFLAMAKLKRGIGVMILSLIVFMFPAMLSFGNIAPFSSSLTSVPPYLPPLS